MTGYTYLVGEGKITSTRDYLMTIIRAFTHDLPLDTQVAEETIEDSPDVTYCREELGRARRKLYRLNKLDAREWLELARGELGYQYDMRDEDGKRSRRNLGNMYKKVLAWQPANGQAEIKKLALDQLKKSLDFKRNSLQDARYVNLLTFRRSCLENANGQIQYYHDQLYQADVENKKCGSFFRDFISSLDGLD